MFGYYLTVSAMKERKKIRRDKRMDVGPKGGASSPTDFSSASSTKQPKHNAADAQLCTEKVGISLLPLFHSKIDFDRFMLGRNGVNYFFGLVGSSHT